MTSAPKREAKSAASGSCAEHVTVAADDGEPELAEPPTETTDAAADDHGAVLIQASKYKSSKSKFGGCEARGGREERSYFVAVSNQPPLGLVVQ